MGCSSSASRVSEPLQKVPDPESPKSFTLNIDTPVMHDFHCKYKLGPKIAKGGFGQVHLAKHRRSGEANEVAVKVLNLLDSNGLRKVKKCKAACQEVSVSTHVGKHPNLVQLLDSVFDDHLCYMVMEVCPVSLSSHILNMEKVNESNLAAIFSQMLMGIAHMHSLNIVHRDIKSQNFLIGKDMNVKLADFGLSAYVPEGGEVEGFCGTVSHMSPELVKNSRCGLEADIWSFGVIAHVFLCGAYPYSPMDTNMQKMKAAIADGEPVNCRRKWLSSTAVTFLTDALERDPKSRPTAAQMLDAQFLTWSSRRTNLVDLRVVVLAAEETGAFVSHDITMKSTVDHLMHAMKQGKLTSHTRAMTHDQVDSFLHASLEEKDHLAEEFWSTQSALKRHEDSVSSAASTTYKSSTSGSSGKLDKVTNASSDLTGFEL